MDFAKTLQMLREAQGDRVKLALTSIDLVYSFAPEDDRAALKKAFQTAAVPHWCDERILAKLLGLPEAEAAAQLGKLRELKVLESHPARGESAVNVHEATRLAIRQRLAQDEAEWFRMLTARAADFFADNPAPSDRIEWIYHLLCSEPDNGADELEKLNRVWCISARPEERLALSTALRELVDNDLVQGRARLWVVLAMAWTRASREEYGLLAATVESIVQLARSTQDPSAEASALSLSGDVFEAQGKLSEAQACFEQHLAIASRLTDLDPDNPNWQWDRAVAYYRLGGVFEAQGDLPEAHAAFDQYLAISSRLAEQDPANTSWQRGLATAHNRLGDVFEALGNLAEAHTAFKQSLAISRRLVEQDPANARWQQDLATVHNRLGDVFEAQGNLAEAHASFEQCLAISRLLVDQDPANASLQRDLAAAHNRLGGVFEAQDNLAEAQAAFEQNLAISRRLAEQDPANANWQRELAVAHSRLGGLSETQGNLAAARSSYAESVRLLKNLTERTPDHALWREDLEAVQARLAQLSEPEAGA